MSYSSPYTCPFLKTTPSSNPIPYYQVYNISTNGTGILQQGPMEPAYPCCFLTCDNWWTFSGCGWGNCISSTGINVNLWPQMTFDVSFAGTISISTLQSTLLTTASPSIAATCYNSSGIQILGTMTIKTTTDTSTTTTTSSISILFKVDPAKNNYYTQILGTTTKTDLGVQGNGYQYYFYTTPCFNLILNPSTGLTWFYISINFKINANYLYGLSYSGEVTVNTVLTAVALVTNELADTQLCLLNTTIQ